MTRIWKVMACCGAFVAGAAVAAAPRPAPPVGPSTISAAGPSSISKRPRLPHTRPAAGATLSMSLEELGNFEFDPEKDTTVPDDVMSLNGCKVSISGYMIPLTQAENII